MLLKTGYKSATIPLLLSGLQPLFKEQSSHASPVWCEIASLLPICRELNAIEGCGTLDVIAIAAATPVPAAALMLILVVHCSPHRSRHWSTVRKMDGDGEEGIIGHGRTRLGI